MTAEKVLAVEVARRQQGIDVVDRRVRISDRTQRVTVVDRELLNSVDFAQDFTYCGFGLLMVGMPQCAISGERVSGWESHRAAGERREGGATCPSET